MLKKQQFGENWLVSGQSLTQTLYNWYMDESFFY